MKVAKRVESWKKGNRARLITWIAIDKMNCARANSSTALILYVLWPIDLYVTLQACADGQCI